MSLHDITDNHKPELAYPHNIEAEQAVLGALLMDNRLIEKTASIIDPAAFYDPVHSQLYGVIARLIEAQRLASPITLKPIVHDWPDVTDGMAVWQYLGRLVGSSAPHNHVEAYAKTLADLAARRKMISLAHDMIAHAMEAPIDTPAETMVEEAERGLFEIIERRIEGREVSLATAVGQAIDVVAKAYERGGTPCGVPTGLLDLDVKLGGFQDSDLIILGGRPAMGKSALAMVISYNVARTRISEHGEVIPGDHVHVFSQEMSAAQLALRLVGDQSETSSDMLRRGAIDEQRFRAVIDRSNDVAAASMTIDETGGISLGTLAAKARRVKRKHGTKLIVIDYLQLMSGANKYGDNRVQEITKITMGLKALAKELDVPILALSQLSRKVEDRSDKRPQLADLRESGSIEQDADVVMFVYRDEYYIEREKPDETTDKYADWQQRMDRAHGKAEVIIAKHRHGPVGTVAMAFDGRYARFSTLASKQHEDGRYAP